MKAYILGAYGAGNLGDDLLFEVAANNFKMRGYIPVCVGYGDPSVSKNCEFILIKDFHKTLPSVSNEDIVAIGGGGIFWSDESAIIFSSLIATAKLKGNITEVLAIGLNNVDCDAKKIALRLLYRSSDYFSVRDNVSFKILSACCGEVPECVEPDLVAQKKANFLFRRKERLEKKNQKLKVGINLHSTRMSQDVAYREHIGLSIGNAIKQLSGEADFFYIAQVRHRLSLDEQCLVYAEWLRVYSEGLITVQSAPSIGSHLINEIHKMDIMLAGRLHSGIIATRLHLPTAIIVEDEANQNSKYLAFAEANGLPTICMNQHNWNVTDDIVSMVRKNELARGHFNE